MNNVVIAILKSTDSSIARYFLVASKKDFGKFTHYYYPPGGHVEKNESLESALIRECKEELGIGVSIISHIATTPGDVSDQITHWYTASIEKDMNIQWNKEELHDAGFFTLEEIRQMKLWPATKKFFQEYLGL